VKIFITEVGPRDGLQNESAHISTEAKVEFINALSQTGLHEIEVSAFVSPKWIPQLADAKEVFDLDAFARGCGGVCGHGDVLTGLDIVAHVRVLSRF